MGESGNDKNGNTQSWWRRVIAWYNYPRTFQAGRLRAVLGAYRAELASRVEMKATPNIEVIAAALAMVDQAQAALKARKLDQAALTLDAARRLETQSFKSEVIAAALAMITQAQTALKEGNLDQAALTFDAARRLEIESFDDKRLALQAKSLLEESEKLSSEWRRKAIKSNLEKTADCQLCSVREAMKIRDEDLENTHFKISFFAHQVGLLAIVAAGLVGLIVILAWNGAFSPPRLDPGDWLHLIVVITYGALGGTVSTMLSLTPKRVEPRIPVQIFSGTLALARPILGATMAVAVDRFYQLGLITINVPHGIDYIAMSFGAGFSDRFLLSAINNLLRGAATKPKEEGDGDKGPKAKPGAGRDGGQGPKPEPEPPAQPPGAPQGGEVEGSSATPNAAKAAEKTEPGVDPKNKGEVMHG